MAKRTKRTTTTRKLKSAGRAQKRGKPAKRQAGKRLVKAKAKRQITKGKKRAVAKRLASRRPTTPAQPNNLETETTIVDVLEEPVPGVMVVTELEETHTRLNQDQTRASPSEKKNPE
jgi:hypothetical protein